MAYLQVRTDPSGWSGVLEAYPAPGITKLACCDCGLVHDIKFWVEDDRVRFRVRQNARATGQIRRWMRAHGEGVFDVGSRVARAIMQRVQGR